MTDQTKLRQRLIGLITHYVTCARRLQQILDDDALETLDDDVMLAHTDELAAANKMLETARKKLFAAIATELSDDEQVREAAKQQRRQQMIRRKTPTWPPGPPPRVRWRKVRWDTEYEDYDLDCNRIWADKVIFEIANADDIAIALDMKGWKIVPIDGDDPKWHMLNPHPLSPSWAASRGKATAGMAKIVARRRRKALTLIDGGKKGGDDPTPRTAA
jgi:hypothetical protein